MVRSSPQPEYPSGQTIRAPFSSTCWCRRPGRPKRSPSIGRRALRLGGPRRRRRLHLLPPPKGWTRDRFAPGWRWRSQWRRLPRRRAKARLWPRGVPPKKSRRWWRPGPLAGRRRLHRCPGWSRRTWARNDGASPDPRGRPRTPERDRGGGGGLLPLPPGGPRGGPGGPSGAVPAAATPAGQPALTLPPDSHERGRGRRGGRYGGTSSTTGSARRRRPCRGFPRERRSAASGPSGISSPCSRAKDRGARGRGDRSAAAAVPRQTPSAKGPRRLSPGRCPERRPPPAR